MRAIANWEEVPIFDSEEAEADFWAENKPDGCVGLGRDLAAD